MAKLLEPDAQALAPTAPTPQRDRAPDELAAGTPAELREALVALVGAPQVLSRPIDLVRYASDASPYRLFPKAVVIARGVDDVGALFAFARDHGESITLRAAGTSLNGQAQGDGILVDVRRHWSGVTVEDGGRRLRVRPGTILCHANRALAPHGHRLGPDPASAAACTVGGVIANNSSGMRCGTKENAYRTLESITFVLPSGTLIDTAAADAEAAFARREPELAEGLLAISARSRPTPSSPSGCGASSRSRTRPAIACARSSTPRHRWRSSAGCWSARRARWR